MLVSLGLELSSLHQLRVLLLERRGRLKSALYYIAIKSIYSKFLGSFWASYSVVVCLSKSGGYFNPTHALV